MISLCVCVCGGWGVDEWGSRGVLYRNVCLSLYMCAVRWRANCSRFTPTPLSSGCCDLPPLPPRPFKGLGQPKMSQWSLNKQNVVFFIWRIYMERQVTENVFQLHFFWHSNLQPSAGTHARKFSKSAFLAVLIFCNLCAQKPFTNHSADHDCWCLRQKDCYYNINTFIWTA